MFHFTIWTSGDRDALELIQRIHSAVREGEIPQAGIRAVVCNRIRGEDPEADEFLDWCDGQGLPVISVSSRRLRRACPPLSPRMRGERGGWREELGRRFRELLSPYPAALHLLVGYMLWVDDVTAAELPLLNLHPALPGGPVGTWQEVIRAIQPQRAGEHGATMQWIRPGRENRDRGAPVAFFRFPVTPEMSFDQIRAAGFQREPILLIETLKALARGHIHLGEGPALDLTKAVGAGLAPAQRAKDLGEIRSPSPLIAFFDLEGPLSPQDNAYEVMGLIPRGHELFAVISRYDDLLALAEKPGYEPGDTLALILPFLAAHQLTAEDVRRVSQRARLVEGARELVAQLQREGWGVYIISTSYAPHAHCIADELGVSCDHVACTPFPAEGYQARLDEAAQDLIHRMEGQMLALSPEDDQAIQSLLDRFYWEELPATGWGDPLAAMQVMGGRRKAEAAQRFASECGVSLSDVVAVGDSITDAALLQAVEKAGGLALAFNANTYALPHATAAVASTTLQDLAALLQAWEEGGRSAVEAACAQQPDADWLAGRDLTPEIIERHRAARGAVRGRAAALG